MQSNIKKNIKFKKKAIFLIEADNIIGFGHLNRCHLLAEIFHKNNYECYIFGINKKLITKNFYKNVFQKFPIHKKKIDLDFIKKKINSNNFFLIIDTFKINYHIQKILLQQKIKWIQFDNFQNRNKIYSDVIINANPLVKKKDYIKRLHKKKRQVFLLGKKYLILRDEFKKNYKKKSKFILICSGGGLEDNNFTYVVLKTILKIYNFENIIVILQKNDPREILLNSLKFGTNKVKFIKKNKNISKFFAHSKIVYLSGGTILIESLFYDLKRYACSIAENQIKNCLAWQKLGFVNYLGNLSNDKLNQIKINNKISNSFINKNKILNKKFLSGKNLIFKRINKII